MNDKGVCRAASGFAGVCKKKGLQEGPHITQHRSHIKHDTYLVTWRSGDGIGNTVIRCNGTDHKLHIKQHI